MADPKNPLYRARTDRMIGGVCGGFAKWLGWDVTLVRVLYVLFSIFSAAFPGMLVYVVFWAIMPEEPLKEINGKDKKGKNRGAAGATSS